jgi:5-formyltetrahydrofolate cyclo-ligase
MNAQVEKQSIRERIIAARQQLAEDERDRLSRAIAARIFGMEGYRLAGTVLAYMNFGAEFAASMVARQALHDGKRVLLPKVNRISNELSLYRVADLRRDVAPGLWSIPEPLEERCARVDALEEIDFVLLPGVAFGRDGTRLGYGGGYYDKLLARVRHHPALVAGAYAMQVVESLPQEACDCRVEWLVTEHETMRCAASGNASK